MTNECDMHKVTEELIQQVVIDRDFEIRIHLFGGEIAVTVTDPNDPREGCAQLRGESAIQIGVEEAIADACDQAVRNAYPQATACARCIEKRDGEWLTCILPPLHDGECRIRE